jgi:hypothetical protein
MVISFPWRRELALMSVWQPREAWCLTLPLLLLLLLV